MSTRISPTEQATHELDEALARASKGERDPVRAGKAIQEMRRMSEELRQRIGTVNVAVDLIRELRDQ